DCRIAKIEPAAALTVGRGSGRGGQRRWTARANPAKGSRRMSRLQVRRRAGLRASGLRAGGVWVVSSVPTSSTIVRAVLPVGGNGSSVEGSRRMGSVGSLGLANERRMPTQPAPQLSALEHAERQREACYRLALGDPGADFGLTCPVDDVDGYDDRASTVIDPGLVDQPRPRRIHPCDSLEAVLDHLEGVLTR